MSTKKKLIYVLLALIVAFGSVGTAALTHVHGVNDTTVFNDGITTFEGIQIDSPAVVAGSCDLPSPPSC